ncbi:hypothetical protein QAD02_018413 [Eretmocerus hayati]|uniref:Uncharacterized protein n=1 Tax=Eretmocerus hayati TaxID=131215 RepID=A0ACC2PHY4_9HYME|nr:hypothetical protein QAD02_018413 [Eretmocerus hayati]
MPLPKSRLYCAVPGCPSKSGVPKFGFLADDALREKWFDKIGSVALRGKTYAEIADARWRVCHKHFIDDYKVYRADGMRKTDDAIPTLNLLSAQDASDRNQVPSVASSRERVETVARTPSTRKRIKTYHPGISSTR